VKRCGIALENLADYRDGRASAAVARQIQEHLDAGCPHCRETLAWLQRAADTLQQAQSVQVPQPLVDRAHALFAERFRPPVRRSWTAWLQFDGRSSVPALAGARGGQPDSFQMVYSTDAHDIELFQEPAEEGNWYIIGQVMPKEGDATLTTQEIVLTGSDQRSFTFASEGEEFHLSAVPAGVYEVTLRLAEEDILLPHVAIGQQAAA
jgi:hypothetical protein